MLDSEELLTECLIGAGTDNATDALSTLCNGSSEASGGPVLPEFTPPLWQADFSVAVVYVAYLCVAMAVGAVGNVIIVIVSATTSTMNKVGRDFVINLALADLCVNVVAEPMCILGVIKGEKWFNGRWLLCELVAGMCITACFCAFLSLTVITINKYLYVCQNRFYQKFAKRSVCIVICVICWILAFVFEFPNLIGWGNHSFDKKNHQCIWERTASLSYTMLVSIGFIGGPLVTMALCFVLIFVKIWQTKHGVFKLNHDDPLRMRRVWVESLRTSRTLVVVFVAFLTCWTPYAVITSLDFKDEFPTEVHLFTTLLAHSHSSLNFGIYMTFSASFRQTVKKMFACALAPCGNPNNSLDTTSRTTSEFTRSETENEKFKKYYINSSFQPTIVNDPKVTGEKIMSFSDVQDETSDVQDETPSTNDVDSRNNVYNGTDESNGYEKY